MEIDIFLPELNLGFEYQGKDHYFPRSDRGGEDGFKFDNITFVLNCVDTLAGDEGYVALRKRRPIHRTLTLLEEKYEAFKKDLAKETKDAEEKAEKALEEAEKNLEDMVKEIEEKRTDLDPQSRRRLIEAVRDRERRRFELQEIKIEDEKRLAIEQSKSQMKKSEKAIHMRVRWLSVTLPPLLPFFLALFMWFMRWKREGKPV